MAPARLANLDRVSAGLILWLVVCAICFGLGYATLGRYDARKTSVVDTIQYYNIVEHSPQQARGHWRYRVLVPYLAKPVYHAFRGRSGTWNPVFFSLLVVNSAFVASTVLLVFLLSNMVVRSATLALLAGCLFLLNFAVANAQLAGLVDSSEAFLLALLTWALFKGHWQLLPFLGILGGLAKETFVPLAVVFATLWWILSSAREPGAARKMAWIVLMGFVGTAVVVAVQTKVEGHMVWPWVIVAKENAKTSFLAGVVGQIGAKTFWYVFIWQLPLAIWQISRLPRTWVIAALGSSLVAFLLGAYNNSEGNVARAMFNCAGPLLSLAAAMSLVQVARALGEPSNAAPREIPEAL